MRVVHNRKITISVGNHRKSVNWQPQRLTLLEMYEKLRLPGRSAETHAQYLTMSRSQQDDLKDIGGFVAGALKGIRRKTGAVVGRDIVTLDLDKIPPMGTEDILRRIEGLGCGYCVYSTRKHHPAAPRLRVLLPLDRTATAEEYEAAARKVAEVIGLEFADPSTFEPSRLMYWPSVCADGEYIYHWQDKAMLALDGVLAQYVNWKDMTSWPRLTSENAYIKRAMKQGNPTTKSGVVGAFCRTYNIYEAMDEFLPGVYESCDMDDRFTYTEGSTTGGAIVYDGGIFLYSHHSTDPCGGKLVNAFDLVRLHKFEGEDDDAALDTPINRLPSYKKMIELTMEIAAVKGALAKERSSSSATEDFGGIEIDENWHERLDIDSKGRIRQTSPNVLLILQNDPVLRDRMAMDEFAHREVMLGMLPWRKAGDVNIYLDDKDDSGLRVYLERKYQISTKAKIEDALKQCTYDNGFHPVRDFITAQTWDYVPRLDTHYIDYLGVEDSEYTRAVSRKSFVACVARIFNPGVKFDYVLVLVGPQGRGKSTIIKKIAKEWFSDSLNLSAGKEKDAYEQLQGAWIIEFGELAALRNAEVNQIKHFITKTDDRYRVAYGRRVENFARQCVFFGTSNTRDFLKDPTGERRWWPLDIAEDGVTKKNVFVDLTDYEVGQLWAEAYHYYIQGEKIYLPPHLEKMARVQQEAHSEENPKQGMIENYLDMELPLHWDKMELSYRQQYVQSPAYRRDTLSNAEGAFKRSKVCTYEIRCELFGEPNGKMGRAASLEISNILRRIKGWKEGEKIRVPIYGPQKCFERIEQM